jgi:site-specific recombinase XerD
VAISGNARFMRSIKLMPTRSSWAANAKWSVSLPPRVSTTGKRQRFFFDTKQGALNFCEATRTRVENFGTKGSLILPPAQQEQAANALAELQPYGVTLNEVVQDWLSRRKASDASISFEAAMDLFLESGKRSESYTRSVRQTRNRLGSLHGKLLNMITPADLRSAMDGMPDSVKNFTIRILGGLFNFAIKRGHCAENPTKRLDLAKREGAEIEVYSPAESAAILAAAEQAAPEIVPFLAVSFFTGIRRSEALRLDWSAIDLHENFVKLPGAITKTKQVRHIELSENCKAWITPFAKERGPLLPCSANVLRTRERELRTSHKVRAIKHGPRHAFASYWLAMHGDINKLCLFTGHDDPATLFRHYAKAATKRDAEKFWAIMPKAAAARNVIEFRRKGRAA